MNKCLSRRGPNRYTRNWEDENAYGKVLGNIPSQKTNTRKSKSGEEFPALCPHDNVSSANIILLCFFVFDL